MLEKIGKMMAFIGLIAKVITAAYETFKVEWETFKVNFPPEPEYDENAPNPNDVANPAASPVTYVDPLATFAGQQTVQTFEAQAPSVATGNAAPSVT